MNPLLKPYDTPFETIPFSRIRNEHYLPAVKAGIEEGLAEVTRIVDDPRVPDFDNTIVALERSGKSLDRVLNVFFPLLSANADDEMMNLSMEISPLLSEYSTSISLNRGLWERIKCVYDTVDRTRLSPEELTLLKETYDGFARSGALLEGEARDDYKRMTARLSELTVTFGQNVLKELNTYRIFLGPDDLAGLPADVVEQASRLASEAGHDGEYLFTLEQPTYIAFMKHSSRRDLRERFYRLYSGRNITGEYSNVGIMKEIAELRLGIARLLGRDTFAAFALEHTMAHDPRSVMRLLDSLRSAYATAANEEMSRLTDFALRNDNLHGSLQPWDYSYYANKFRQQLFDYDEEALRPYFRLEHVIDGVFGLATRLYGIRFKQRYDIETYHPDVKAYEVTDGDGSYLGVLYADFFPRESKRPGAWMTDFKSQWTEDDATDSRPHVSIVMNFTKSTPTKPSLLTPYEVSTFLHEFGHALHGLLSRVRFASLSGTNVRRDFVELPSQFNENFLHSKEFLDGFARHYVTGEHIPDGLVDKLISSAQFGAAYACMRQLSFGLLDMAWHSITSSVIDAMAFEREAMKSVRLFEPVDGAMMSPQFSHIFAGGYAAGYYSYKWAEVLDADAFAKFKEEGLFNRATADSFRRNILERGGSEDPALLYRRFRGHEPSIDALLIRDGIRP